MASSVLNIVWVSIIACSQANCYSKSNSNTRFISKLPNISGSKLDANAWIDSITDCDLSTLHAFECTFRKLDHTTANTITTLPSTKETINTNPSLSSFQQIVSCILYASLMPKSVSLYPMIFFALSTALNAQNLTLSPTDVTMVPTMDPTVDPTPSPTRVPTVTMAYDSIFAIRYLISNLNQTHIDMLVSDAQTVSDKITDIIEKSYSKETGLMFVYFFWLKIREILGFKIKDIDASKYSQFLTSMKEISLSATIRCDYHVCDLLLTPQIQPSFQLEAQTKLREYFGSESVNFSIDVDVSTIKVKRSESSVFDVSLVGFIVICNVYLVVS